MLKDILSADNYRKTFRLSPVSSAKPAYGALGIDR